MNDECKHPIVDQVHLLVHEPFAHCPLCLEARIAELEKLVDVAKSALFIKAASPIDWQTVRLLENALTKKEERKPR